MIFGLLLVLLGAIYLAVTLEMIEGITVGELWPVLLIALGLSSISGSLRFRRWRRSWRHSSNSSRSRRYWSDW
jgi:hypothetical protein